MLSILTETKNIVSENESWKLDQPPLQVTQQFQRLGTRETRHEWRNGKILKSCISPGLFFCVSTEHPNLCFSFFRDACRGGLGQNIILNQNCCPKKVSKESELGFRCKRGFRLLSLKWHDSSACSWDDHGLTSSPSILLNADSVIILLDCKKKRRKINQQVTPTCK